MSTSQLSDIRPRPASNVHSSQMTSGRDSQGKLWSSLREIFTLLQCPCKIPVTDQELLFQHVQYKTGQRIHTIGQEFDALCVIYSGFLKTVSIDEFGNEQVLSFPMKGDILGVDSIYTRQFSSEAVALSDCNMILLPFKKIETLCHNNPDFEHAIFSLMSRELMRKQAIMNMLGAPNAEARVARFLISLSEKFAEIGYSRSNFNLRMSRQEIGSFLGLSLETVSRSLSALNEIGLVQVDQRSIKIVEHDTLATMRRIPPSRSRAKQRDAAASRAAKWPTAAANSLATQLQPAA
ncbi:hypothetical protein BH11PSE11_BH11PSE11_35660 [soil metagenome]